MWESDIDDLANRVELLSQKVDKALQSQLPEQEVVGRIRRALDRVQRLLREAKSILDSF